MKKHFWIAAFLFLFIAPLLANSPAPGPIPNYEYDDFSYSIDNVELIDQYYRYEGTLNNQGDNYVIIMDRQALYGEEIVFISYETIFESFVIMPYKKSHFYFYLDQNVNKELNLYYEAYEQQSIMYQFSYATVTKNDNQYDNLYLYNVKLEFESINSDYYYNYILKINLDGNVYYTFMRTTTIYAYADIDASDINVEEVILLQGHKYNSYNDIYILLIVVTIAALILGMALLSSIIAMLVILIVVINKRKKTNSKTQTKQNQIDDSKNNRTDN